MSGSPPVLETPHGFTCKRIVNTAQRHCTRFFECVFCVLVPMMVPFFCPLDIERQGIDVFVPVWCRGSKEGKTKVIFLCVLHSHGFFSLVLSISAQNFCGLTSFFNTTVSSLQQQIQDSKGPIDLTSQHPSCSFHFTPPFTMHVRMTDNVTKKVPH